jgi:STE24 endopeptidase
MKTVFIILFVLVLLVRFLLRQLNIKHLRQHGHEVPAGFEDAIDADTLQKTTEYTLAKDRLDAIESVVDTVLTGLFLFTPLLPWFDHLITSMEQNFIVLGLIYFLILGLVQGVVGIPFSLYRNFVLEEKFGFNTMTFKLWLADLLKGTLLSLLITGLLMSGVFALILYSPQWWWLWVWVFVAIVTLFLMYLSPYVIEPLFFKFEPVQKQGLEEGVRAMAEKAGLTISKIQQVDASRRSRHGNAYFTGIGKVKRIVLFDTLLEKLSINEALAVLAHEIGHWKKGHIWKRLVKTEVVSLLMFFFSWYILKQGWLPSLLGLDELSFFSQLIILGFAASILFFPLGPLSSWFSRRDEWQADAFACDLHGEPNDLATALVNMSRDNLANLHPHPVYAWFYYSHPAIVERVGRLRDRK